MDPMSPTPIEGQPTPTTVPPAGSAPPTAPPVAPLPDDWMQGVPADLREKPFFAEQRGKTLGEFYQEAFKQHTEVGRRLPPEKAIQVPATVDAAEWETVFAKLRPETPANYTYKVPESLKWSQEQQDGVKALLWQKGIADAQAHGLMEIFDQAEQQDATALAAARVAQEQEDHRVLRDKFGPDYSARMELANRAMTEFGLTEHLKELDFATDPLLVPALATLGAFLGESPLVKPGAAPGAVGGGQTPEAIQVQLDQVRETQGYKQGDPLVMQEIIRLTTLREAAQEATLQAAARF